MGYAIPMVQSGGSGMPVYAGQRRQVGGSFFSTIKRLAIPLLKHLWPVVKSIGKRFGKSAVNIGSEMAGDLISGRAREIPENFRKRSRAEINSIARDYIGQDVFQPSSHQSGGKRRHLSKKRKGINMKRKSVAKKRRRLTAIDKDIFS